MALYDYNGTPVASDNLASGNVFEYWDSPDYEGMASMNADTAISTLFDPLVDGDYVTKQTIGKDASDTYNMYAYIFAPAAYEQTIWIQAGVHGREKAAVYGLAKFLDEVVNNWQSHRGLNYIRNNVRMIVVPIVNPWGMSQTNPTDENSNDVNLNRDGVAQTQLETQNVVALFTTYKDYISVAIDYHTTVNNSYGDYAYRYPSTSQMKNLGLLKQTIAYLCQKNIEGTPDLHYFGGSDIQTFIYYYNSVLTTDIVVCTPEHADYVWDAQSLYSAVCIQRASEFITNTVIQHVGEHYRDHAVLSKYFA